MSRVDLDKIIEKYSIELKELEEVLFPNYGDARQALYKVRKFGMELKADQLFRLSRFLGVDVDKLYDYNDWAKSHDGERLKFEKDGYTAFLDNKTWVTTVLVNDTIITEEILVPGTTTYSEYFKKLEEVIASKSE